MRDVARDPLPHIGEVFARGRGLPRDKRDATETKALALSDTLVDELLAANRLRVVRQVRYSLHNQNSIDLVLFLNGLPVATVELKTDFTQSIGDAIDQYRFDRNPKPKGQAAEPLLSFPSGALIHFAVSNSEVAMVTRLAGPATVFLPFNRLGFSPRVAETFEELIRRFSEMEPAALL